MKAPIIVLEGLDACGKSTQVEILLENLREVLTKDLVGFAEAAFLNERSVVEVRDLDL